MLKNGKSKELFMTWIHFVFRTDPGSADSGSRSRIQIQDPDLAKFNEMDPISTYLLVPGDPPDDPSAGVQNPSPLPQYPKLK